MGMDQPTKVVGRRVGAFLIDLLLTTALNSGLFFALAQKYDEVPDGESLYAQITVGDDVWALTGGTAAAYYLLTLGIGLAWWVVLPGLKGWTPGKKLVGIRVVREDGTCPAGIGRNLVRQLLWVADGFPYLIPYLTGFITAMVTRGHRRVGDMVAGTYVVRADAVGEPPLPVSGIPAAPGWYPDPQAQKRLRWWDGQRWTDQTAD